MATLKTIVQEGALDGNVRSQLTDNFNALNTQLGTHAALLAAHATQHKHGGADEVATAAAAANAIPKAGAGGQLAPGWLLVAAPAAANSTGVAGQFAYDSSFVYVCVATNTWKKVAIATW